MLKVFMYTYSLRCNSHWLDPEKSDPIFRGIRPKASNSADII